MHLTGLIWFIATLVLLMLLQRLLHREIQAIFLILSRSPEFTIALFSLLFLPGVLLHELSHYLVAVLLGVPTPRFSLIPQVLPTGKLQLGYVETARTDIVRDSLIGAAPLFAGGLVVAFVALTRLDLLPLWDALRAGSFAGFLSAASVLPRQSDFPLWFYLLFTVSSTMLPSQSDRHAWLPLGIVIAVVVGLAILAGAGPWLLSNLTPPLNAFLSATSVIFGLSAVVHVALIVPSLALHFLAARLTGVDIT